MLDKHCSGIKMVVFHCMLSQIRGPKSAMRFAARLAALGRDSPSVHVLQGGFRSFSNLHNSRPELFEDFDSSVWG